MARRDIRIYYTGDIHWNIPAFSRIARIFKEELKGDFLFFDAGDSISNSSNGMDSVICFNILGLHTMVLGNHELDLPPNKLKPALRIARFNILNPNLHIDGFPTKAYVEIEHNGIHIIVLGVNYPGLVNSQPHYDGYSFSSPYKVIEKNLTKLREKADVLILLSHLGFEADIQIAEKYGEFDIIIGGHTHTVIKDTLIRNNVLVCHSGGEGNYLGRIDITVDDSGAITSKKHSLIELVRFLPDDDFDEVFYNQKREKGILTPEAILAEAVVSFVENKYSGETALGDLITDILYKNTGVDIVFLNATCVNPILTRGPITEEKLRQVIYWDNKYYSGQMDTQGIYELFGAMLKRFLSDPYYFCYFSGIEIQFIRGPVCRRINQFLEGNGKIVPQSSECSGDIELCKLCKSENTTRCLRGYNFGDNLRIYKDGKPLDPKKSYSILTTGYLLNGGLNAAYKDILDRYAFEHIELNLFEIFKDYLRNNKQISYKKDMRLKIYSM